MATVETKNLMGFQLQGLSTSGTGKSKLKVVGKDMFTVPADFTCGKMDTAVFTLNSKVGDTYKDANDVEKVSQFNVYRLDMVLDGDMDIDAITAQRQKAADLAKSLYA